MTALVSHNKCFITLVIHTRPVSGAVSIGVSFYFNDFSCIVSIAHPRLYHHRNSLLLKWILRLGNFDGMQLSGGKFCSEVFGVWWKCYGLFCFWLLPRFDNPCYLKSGVSPLWLWIFVYDYGKPNSKALASQGGDLVHMSISRLSSKCIACFFFYWMFDAILTGMCFGFKQHCGIHIMWRSLSCRLWLHNITRECDIVCSRNLF